MNTQNRRGRLAALALTGAVAGVMLVPLSLGVASASAGYVAGGPPAPAPVRHITKPIYIHKKEKPIFKRSHRWHAPDIDVIVHNRNHSRNRNDRHEHHRRHELDEFKHHHDHHKHEKFKKEPMTTAPEADTADVTAPDPAAEPVRYNGPWWWPAELS